MKRRKFIPLRKDYRARSKARSKASDIEDPMQVDPAVLRPTESTPDLGISSSTLPTSGPLTPHGSEPDSTRTTLFRTTHLTTLFCDTDRHATPDLFRSVFRIGKRNQTKSSDDTADSGPASKNKSSRKSTAYSTTKLAIHLVKESSDAFAPLKSVAGGLSAILKHCDVRSIYPAPHQ